MLLFLARRGFGGTTRSVVSPGSPEAFQPAFRVLIGFADQNAFNTYSRGLTGLPSTWTS
jgi:hypothetical protein